MSDDRVAHPKSTVIRQLGPLEFAGVAAINPVALAWGTSTELLDFAQTCSTVSLVGTQGVNDLVR